MLCWPSRVRSGRDELCYFLAGAFFYYYLRVFERWVGYFVLAAASVLVLDSHHPLPFLEPFALATVVVFCGLYCYLGNFGKYGDFSYGVYIIHFPTIQLLLNGGWLRGSPWSFLAVTGVLTALGAIAMWHLVEKRFLYRSSHYIGSTVSLGEAAPGLAPDAQLSEPRPD